MLRILLDNLENEYKNIINRIKIIIKIVLRINVIYRIKKFIQIK